jgi:hypothetical protein
VAPVVDEQGASGTAAATGQRVLVDRLTTGTTEVFANPDGSFTAEMFVEPVRVRKAGAWVSVDATLVVNADGSWSPMASVTEMRFSGGGAGPLFSVMRGGVSVDVSWPEALPAPEVSGNTATYREVYPGVDLEVSAAGSAVTHRVVVKTREAAQDPRVRTITYGHVVSGGQRLARPAGAGFVVTDMFGEPVFESPEPLMWDSSSMAGTAARVSGSWAVGTAAPSSRDVLPATGDSADEPREGDQVADLPVSLGSDSVTVAPSLAMLDSPSTTFPVSIDPTTAPAISNWTMVDAAWPGVSYYKYTSADQGVGYQNFSAWSRKRLFYGFTTSGLNSTQIVDAKFSAYEVYSAVCTAGTVDAYLAGDVSSGTTWNNQPGRLTGILSSFSVKAGRSDCNPGGYWGTWTVTDAVKNRVAAKASLTTIQLAGRSETTYSSWMRFAGPAHPTVSWRPKLSVTYNNPPAATPTSSMKAPDTATACATSATGAPRINPTSSSAYLYAKAYDAQGGTLYSQFRVSQGSTVKGTYTTPAFTSTAGTWTGYQKAPMNHFTGLANGTTYNWDVVTKDSTSGYVNWSAKCYFIADTAAPTAPTLSTTVDLTQLLPATQVAVPVTFSHPEAASFRYSVAEVDKGYVTASGGKATVNADVTKNVIRVGARARDAALNVGPEKSIWLNKAVPRRMAVYSFLAGDPAQARVGVSTDAALRSEWDLPVGSGTSLAEGRYGRCLFDPSAASCIQDRALEFAPGAPGVVTEHRPARSDDSFTVGAWVFLDENTGVSTIVQQAGTAGAHRLAFDGNADGGQGRFTFVVGSGTTAVTARDGLPLGSAGARVGGWTYVAGTFDKTSGTGYPYGRAWVTTVQRSGWDGMPTQTGGAKVNLAALPTQPSAAAAFRIGDSGTLSDGTQTNPLQGRVDELSSWQAAYDPAPPAGQTASTAVQDAAVEEPVG